MKAYLPPKKIIITPQEHKEFLTPPKDWRQLSVSEAVEAFDRIAQRLAKKKGWNYPKAALWLAQNSKAWQRIDRLRHGLSYEIKTPDDGD